ncbi:MAG: type I-E CRISPR-associated protein Cas6/Cse3/CasE [Alphaproteobacteria bacterium]|nr:type I-E CRISPR-associated protein Cas6/Cse3/CasE [Alphaproteobacteria bacterium]
MHISRLSLKRDPSSLGKLSALLRGGLDAGRSHRLLWALFRDGADMSRPFLFRSGDGNPVDGDFMTVSPVPPKDETDLWRIETKPFDPHIAKGQTLAFKLRLNPIVESKGKRYDVVAKIKRELGPSGERAFSNDEIWEMAAKRWLEPRAERLGVSFKGLRADAYQLHRFDYEKKGVESKVSFASLDVSGLLKVEEPEALKAALMSGVGKARAWGCGLLLVKPA